LTRFSVLCLDMAGTTVRDDNTVMEAFATAIGSRVLPVREFNAAMRYARATMGQSKIEVFRHILGEEDAAQAANAAFEKHYAGAVAGGEISPMPGAVELFESCRAAGTRVCLSTGFAPVTRGAIVDALGWHSLVDLFLSPADAGRGRPWPDMPLTALLRLGGDSVASLAVVGDTPSDVESGLRAGAGLVAGVLSGDSARADLEAVPAATGLPGAPLILDSVADLLPHLA
jgi:phosphoglycolate phosphatase